jgi:sarcosine oxidase subunit beta
VNADVVIVGGGVIGWSVAQHLALAGAGRIVVVDRGNGSTQRATGGFRAQFATEVNVRLSLLSLEKLRVFRTETGVDPGYVPAGYLFVASDRTQLERLRSAMTVQRAAGYLAATELSPDEVLRRSPWLAPDDIHGAVFSPVDGFLRPTEMQRGYRSAAMARGVELLESTVTALAVRDGRIVQVRTEHAVIDCGQVVNAAGAWAATVGALAGIEVPVTPLRRQVAVTASTDVLPATTPMTIFSDGFHLRVRDGQVLLLQPSSPGDDPFDVSIDPAWVEAVTRTARRRVPCLADVPVVSSYAGLYEMSPDGHALLGPAPDLANLLLVNGSSGHGVMHAPALGQLAAECLVSGGARTLDVSALSPLRFREGRPNRVVPLL